MIAQIFAGFIIINMVTLMFEKSRLNLNNVLIASLLSGSFLTACSTAFLASLRFLFFYCVKTYDMVMVKTIHRKLFFVILDLKV